MSAYSLDGYTAEEIQAAREYAAALNYRIADEMLQPGYGFASHVTDTDKQRYADQQRRYAAAIERGEHDQNLTVLQRMIYALTGESVPLLP